MAQAKSEFPIRNRLLQSLPERELATIRPNLERITLKMRDLLYNPDESIQHVYFVEDGVVSLVFLSDNLRVIEVGTIGNEGMVGLPVFLGASSSPLQAFAQVPGEALRLSTKHFQAALSNGASSLSLVLHRYTQALFVQLSASVACNRLHSIEQRCARWLLVTSDRVHGDSFKLSQDFLAQMLGVRRASANQVLKAFRQKEMLDYRNAVITIRNRKKLESVACECYFIIRNEYLKLTGS